MKLFITKAGLFFKKFWWAVVGILITMFYLIKTKQLDMNKNLVSKKVQKLVDRTKEVDTNIEKKIEKIDDLHKKHQNINKKIEEVKVHYNTKKEKLKDKNRTVNDSVKDFDESW